MKPTKPGTKGQDTKEKIIKGAMACLAKYGDRATTFQKIATHCRISQPLVVHYFRKRENIFPSVLETIVDRARVLTEERVAAASSPLDKLLAYLRVSHEIFRSEPEIGNIYLMLYYLAGFDRRYKMINTEIKNVAVARLSAILKDGLDASQFETDDVIALARTIHDSLVGMLINTCTVEGHVSDSRILKNLEESCLNFLGLDRVDSIPDSNVS